MKRLWFVLVLVGLFALSTVGQAAERIVRPGDTLTHISKLTGNSVQQLVFLNQLGNPDRIVSGKRLTFMSPDDVDQAIMWCSKKICNSTDAAERVFYHSIRTDLELGRSAELPRTTLRLAKEWRAWLASLHRCGRMQYDAYLQPIRRFITLESWNERYE